MSSSDDEILVKKNKKVVLDSEDEIEMQNEITENISKNEEEKLIPISPSKSIELEKVEISDKIETPLTPETKKPANISEMNSNSKKIQKQPSPKKFQPKPTQAGNGENNASSGKSNSNGTNPSKEVPRHQKTVTKPTNSNSKSNNSKPKKDSSSKRKEIIALEVLKRWWYVMPAWPPANYDYKEILKANKLREVRPEVWGKEAAVDSHGNSKVQVVAGYPGCYRDSQGAFFDLRPKDSCPSFENMVSKSMDELLQLLLQALEKQLQELKSSDYMSEKLAEKLTKMISRTNELVETKKEEA